MHASERQAALKRAGFTQASLAEELGIRPSAVNGTMIGRTRSRRVEARVAELTGIPLYRLWPDWYPAPEAREVPPEPGMVDFELWEFVERHLEDALRALDPGMPAVPRIRARHRADCYNACIKAGAVAQETSAGTRDVVLAFVNEWVAGYERFNAEKPTAEAIRKWALYPGDRIDESVRLSASDRKAAAVNQGTTVNAPITLTGNKQTLVMGNKIKKQTVVQK